MTGTRPTTAARTTARTRARRGEAAAPPRALRARAVAELVPAIGGAAFRRFGFVQSAVVTRWGEIVGERYANVSTPESIRFPAGRREDGVLSLAVDGGHAPMMQHVAPAIMERVNRFFGYQAVARVVIRQGAPRAVVRPRAAPPLPLGTPPVELGDSLRGIADPELRACLEGLARSLSATVSVPVRGKIS